MQQNQKVLLISLFTLFLTACGGGSGSDSNSRETGSGETGNGETGGGETGGGDTRNNAPQELIANAFSGTSIGLSWLDTGESYQVYRGDTKLAEITDNFYLDSSLTINTSYTYSITTSDVTNNETTATVTAKTLVNNSNDGSDNGAETVTVNDRLVNFSECNVGSRDNAADVADADLDTCLKAMLDLNSMADHLEDLRAFAARVRSEQSAEMVELGMRLFHSKSLGGNGETSCSSCHHPALGCGGDDLSMPIGVNAINPNLIGPGRADSTNLIPIVPRNSPATCNTVFWQRGLFWDNRISQNGSGVNTESADVDTLVRDALDLRNETNSIAMLMAQAHFPVTAAPEMGDATEFGYDDTLDSDLTAYREEHLAGNLSTAEWGTLFTEVYGDSDIDFSRIAESIASYEAVQIFIDNPFFDYVDGDLSAITNTEKRGAIAFMDSTAGCTFCHAGAFFTTEAQLPANYPQIGIGKEANGADLGAENRILGVGAGTSAGEETDGVGVFRAPTLLNVAITGPWGHNGQFDTLKRNVAHYANHQQSITDYFTNNEMCDLDQFKDLANCASILAPNGLTNSQEILDGNVIFQNANSDEVVDLIVAFLGTLTDPDAANSNSNAIQALIPAHDGGPDGNQLDAIDQASDAL